MQFTVYSFGDISTLRAALVAVSMMFDPANNQLFVSNSAIWGAGAVLGMSLLLGVIVMTGVGIMRAEFPAYHHLLILTILYCVCFVPKARVQLEDKISGAVAAVDNVPLAIAMSAGLFSGAISRVSDGIETAISATDPNYIAVGSDGFLSPLRLLHSMRNIASGMPVLAPTIHNNLMRYGFSCVQDAGLSLDMLKRSDDSLATFLQNGQGVVIYVSPSTPTSTGTEMTCSSAGPMILADIGNFQSVPVGGTSLSGLEAALNARVATNASMSGMGLSGPPAQTFTLYNWQNSYASVVGTSSAAAARSQQFMQQSIGSGYVMGAFGCQRTVFEEFVRCASPMIAAQEQARGDAVAGATFYQKLAIPVANLMMFIFFAASPIVIAVAFFMGMAGMRVLVMYLMFGFWSQAWMPFANIVNFYIQRGCREDIMQLLMSYNGVIPLEALNQFYDKVGTRLQVGADMLSATPMISLALMTGSIFAISQVANRMSTAGGDHYDEKVNAPSGISNGPAVSVGGAQSAPVGSQGWQAVASTGGGAAGLSVNPLGQLASTSSVGTTATAAAGGVSSRALSQAASTMKSVSDAVGKVVSNSTSEGSGSRTSEGEGVSGSGTRSVSGGTGTTISDTRSGGTGFSSGNGQEGRRSTDSTLEAGVGGTGKSASGSGTGGNLLKMIGINGGAKISTSVSEAQKETSDAKNSYDRNIGLANQRMQKNDFTGALQAVRDARKSLDSMSAVNTSDAESLTKAAQQLDGLSSSLQQVTSFSESANIAATKSSSQNFNAGDWAQSRAREGGNNQLVRSAADTGAAITSDAVARMSAPTGAAVTEALDKAIDNKAQQFAMAGASADLAKETARLEVYANAAAYAAGAVKGDSSAQSLLAVSGAATQNIAMGNPSAASDLLKGMDLIAKADTQTGDANKLSAAAPTVNSASIEATRESSESRMGGGAQVQANAEIIAATGSNQAQSAQYSRAVQRASAFGGGQMGRAAGAGGIDRKLQGAPTSEAATGELKKSLLAATDRRTETYLESGATAITNDVIAKVADNNDSGKGYPESAAVNAPPIKGKKP